MKRQTYIRFFKKWLKKPRAQILFIPDQYFQTCLKIMNKSCSYRVGIAKKSSESLYDYYDLDYEYPCSHTIFSLEV